MRVRGSNASEDAGPMIWGTDTTKLEPAVKVIYEVYWATMTQTPLYG